MWLHENTSSTLAPGMECVGVNNFLLSVCLRLTHTKDECGGSKITPVKDWRLHHIMACLVCEYENAGLHGTARFVLISTRHNTFGKYLFNTLGEHLQVLHPSEFLNRAICLMISRQKPWMR